MALGILREPPLLTKWESELRSVTRTIAAMLMGTEADGVLAVHFGGMLAQAPCWFTNALAALWAEFDDPQVAVWDEEAGMPQAKETA